MLTVMRSASERAERAHGVLNSGCEGYADLVKQIERQFIDFTEVESWIAPSKNSR